MSDRRRLDDRLGRLTVADALPTEHHDIFETWCGALDVLVRSQHFDRLAGVVDEYLEDRYSTGAQRLNFVFLHAAIRLGAGWWRRLEERAFDDRSLRALIKRCRAYTRTGGARPPGRNVRATPPALSKVNNKSPRAPVTIVACRNGRPRRTKIASSGDSENAACR